MTLVPVNNDHPILDQHGEPLSTDDIAGISEVMHGLPATKRIDDIIAGLDSSNIILVEGATGSGKSTLLPSTVDTYLKEVLKIIQPITRVIQPRVAAATGLAGRISVEQQIRDNDASWQLGQGVGYLTGRGKISSPQSNILLETGGYELRRLMGGGKMPDAMILDEYHTDDTFNQFLGYLVREELLKTKNRMKVIITSATINKLKTLNFFEDINSDMPTISIKGRTFPIENSTFRPAEFYQIMHDILNDGGNTLIFQPGKQEIEDNIQFLKDNAPENVKLFSFHGDMSIEEQRKIINYKPAEGEQVIIVATNSAEESLTIDYLDTLVDSGLVKTASVNYDGVDRLDLERSSLASIAQRGGRVGRTGPGKSLLSDDPELGERDRFTKAPITHATIEDEILMLAYGDVHFSDEVIRQEELGRTMLADMPDSKLVKLSYERLFQFGALDSEGNITELGKKLVGYPISTRGSRMLHEGIERGVSADIVEVVSIMEHNGFLIAGGQCENLYKNKSRIRKKSDSLFELKIYRDLTSRNLSEQAFNFLVFENNLIGCNNYIEYLASGKMFFELFDSESLEVFGANKRALQKISETIAEIEVRMLDNEIEQTNTGDLDDKIISLLSGSLDRVYNYNHRNKGSINMYSEDKTVYKHGKLSGVDLNTDGGMYIGNPFIIGGEGNDQDDHHLLTAITAIDESHLSHFQDILTSRFKGYDNYKSRLIRKYSGIIRKAKNIPEIDVNSISTQFASRDMDLLNSGSISEDSYAAYCALILFYKDLPGDHRSMLKERYSNWEEAVQERFELGKKDKWLGAFISASESLIEGKKVSIPQMSIGISDNSNLLMTDPVISKFGFLSSAVKLKELYFNIKANSGKVGVNDKDIRSLYKLFSSDNRKYNNAKSRFPKTIEKLDDTMLEIDKTIEDISNVKNSKRESRRLARKKKILLSLKKDIILFQSIATTIKTDIDSIDFKQVVFRITDDQRPFLTRKHLLSVLGNIVFNGDFLNNSSRSDQKLKTRMHKYLGDTLSVDEIESTHHSVRILSNSNDGESDIDASFRNAKNQCLGVLSKIHEYKMQQPRNILKIQGQIDEFYNGEIADLHRYIYTILSNIFDEEYLNTISAKTHRFVKSMLGLSINNIDTKFAEFIGGLSINHRLAHNELFKQIDNYNHGLDLLQSDEYSENIPNDFKRERIGNEEFSNYTDKVEGILQTNIELKSIIYGDLSQLDIK